MSNDQMPATMGQLIAQLDAEGIHDHRRYAAVRRYLNFKARKKNHPITGSFELTPLCNFDCPMCYVHLQKEQMNGKKLLTVEQWKDIMQQAIDNGLMYASLTGGECLTYPGFKELYLFLQNKGIELNVLSNGFLMDAEMVGFLKKNPPALVQITLYGSSDENYERVTGRRAFHVVWDNITALDRAGIPVKIAITPNAYMQDGKEVIRLLHQTGYPFAINAGLMQPRKETQRGLFDANRNAYIEMLRLSRELNGRQVESECDVQDLPLTGVENETAKPEKLVKGVSCGGGRSCFSVDWQGGMRPCNAFPCEPEDVLTLGFAEAWKRTNQKARDFLRPVECEDCIYKKQCKHCAAEHASGAPIGHANPEICAWRKQMSIEGLLEFQKL